MRRFHSYGPVDKELHFCVPRKELVKTCTEHLVGHPEKGGHYFTMWAPRQTGKTWLMREVKSEIGTVFGDRFIAGTMSMQGVIMEDNAGEDDFLPHVPRLLRDTFGIKTDVPKNWNDWTGLFHRSSGIFDRPVILFIDEFDSLPPKVIDRLVTLFRDMYLTHENYLLHGLVLIGVRAVLGIASRRGSPFNIQRSLHIPNFTKEEVKYLFDQYSRESGQIVHPEVVEEVFGATDGQPGLVGWFGELLTEKYNPAKDKPIDSACWEDVFESALHTEWNNTVLNLIRKVKAGYETHVLELFSKSDIVFSLDTDWCSYLYLNGVITSQQQTDASGKKMTVCRFSSPFIQRRLYNALTYHLIGDRIPFLALDPLDDLADVFAGDDPNLPALLQRYKDYLARLKAKNTNPFAQQPRRADLHFTEAAGHFHLYAWLKEAIGRECVISPEFPTGNGKVDLHICCQGKKGIIEVKSFVNLSEARRSRTQAARYAEQLGLNRVTLAIFVPVSDETVLNKLSGEELIGKVLVNIIAIGWE